VGEVTINAVRKSIIIARTREGDAVLIDRHGVVLLLKTVTVTRNRVHSMGSSSLTLDTRSHST
jgi:hypothetical protein